MNKDLLVFDNVEFGQLRTLTVNGEFWFVASDVCKILGLTNTTMAVDRLDGDERSKFNLGRQGETNCVNEFGLYSLILASRKSQAKTFKRWVTHEVLPSIRKTGEYQTPKKRKESLSSINNAARTILPVLEKAGMKAEYQVYMLKQLYDKVGVEIPVERMEQEERLYDKTAIAKNLGVLSKNGNPHAHAIGAIISKIDIGADEKELTSFEKNGHVGTEYQYKESVMDKIRYWLEDNNYPSAINTRDRSYKVSYEIEVEVV